MTKKKKLFGEFKDPDWKSVLEEAMDWFYRMAIHPRETMREIIDINPMYWQLELMVAMSLLGGIAPIYQGLPMMSLNIILNTLVNFAVVYLTAVTIWLTGLPMGGRATCKEVCTAVVWSSVPVIVGSAVGVVLSILGPGVYELGSGGAISFFGLPFSFFDWLQLGLILWSCEWCLMTVAEVQGFDLKKAGLNLTLGGVAMGIALIPPALLLVAMLAPLFSSLGGF